VRIRRSPRLRRASAAGSGVIIATGAGGVLVVVIAPIVAHPGATPS
jgi:hypothetical protein